MSTNTPTKSRASKKTRAEKGTEKEITNLVLILDQSGSMLSVRSAAIQGFNDQVETAQSAKEQYPNLETLVTLTLFNHEVDIREERSPLSELKVLTPEDYKPNGMTAMYDAVGQTVSRLEPNLGPNEAVLVVIISDGLENSSREYTAERLAELIQRLEGSGNWTFTYLGSNQDLNDLSTHLNIKTANMATFDSSTAQGLSVAMDAVSASGMTYYASRSSGQTNSANFYGAGKIRHIEDEDDN